MRAALRLLLVSFALLAAWGVDRPAEAQPALVASSGAGCTPGAGTGHACPLGAAVPAHAAIVACGSNVTPADWTGTTDGTNTYNVITNVSNLQTTTSARRLSCYLALDVPAGSYTPSMNTAGSSSGSVVVGAFTGIKTSSALVTSANPGALGSASTQTCSSVTPTAANQALFGAVETQTSNPSDITAHSSETRIAIAGTRIQLEWKLTPNTTPLTPSWNFVTTADGAACGSFILDLIVTPTFTGGPTVAKLSNTAVRFTFTSSAGSYTARCGMYLKGATPPTAAEVAAGTNAHGTNSVATTGSSQTLDCTTTDSPAAPAYDPYIIIDNAGTYSSVPGTTTTCLDPPTNFLYTNCSAGLTSIATGSPAKAVNDLNLVTIPYGTQTANFTVGGYVVGATSGAYGSIEVDADAGSTGTLTINATGTFQNAEVISDNYGGSATTTSTPTAYPDYATGAIEVVPTTVSPSGATLTVDNGGSFSYDSGATGRQTALNVLVSEAGVYRTVDIDFVDHDSSPACSGSASPIVLKTNTAITTIDLNSGASDADGDTIHWARISGAVPAGLAYNANTGAVTGTPTVENEGGVLLTFIGYDGYGGTCSKQLNPFIITSWTVGNYVGMDQTAATTAIGTLTDGSFSVAGGNIVLAYANSNSVAYGLVISQNPAAGGELAPDGTMTLTLSLGPTPAAGAPNPAHMHGVDGFGLGK